MNVLCIAHTVYIGNFGVGNFRGVASNILAIIILVAVKAIDLGMKYDWHFDWRNILASLVLITNYK